MQVIFPRLLRTHLSHPRLRDGQAALTLLSPVFQFEVEYILLSYQFKYIRP